MENKYIQSLVECSNKQNGRIKDIINKARMEIEKCNDIYQPGKCRKYQLEISEQAMKMIQSIQHEYLLDCQRVLQHHELELRVAEDNKNDKNNVDRLLDEITKMNKIQMTQIQCQAMTVEELFSLAKDNNDQVVVDIVKANILSRQDVNPQDRISARQLRAVTEWDLLAQANAMFKQEEMNPGALLPGMELHQELAINNAGGLRAFIEMDVEPFNPQQE